MWQKTKQFILENKQLKSVAVIITFFMMISTFVLLQDNITSLGRSLEFRTETLPNCSLIPPGLIGSFRPVRNISLIPNMTEKYFPLVSYGGKSKPTSCKARHKVAIIVPVKDREEHLKILLYNLHPMLVRQQLDYAIYVIEQWNKLPFNRATLLNIGVDLAMKIDSYHCYVFHDVDLVPENDKNIYNCKDEPHLLCAARDINNYTAQYQKYFGGVSSMRHDHFLMVNGFSNKYWGWGGEDDNMYERFTAKGLNVTRSSPEISRYVMLPHQQRSQNAHNAELLHSFNMEEMKHDGLSSLKYEVIKKTEEILCRRFIVKMNQTGVIVNYGK